MLKTLVLYSSKYGSTRDAARIISLITGPAKYCSVDEFIPEYMEFDFIVVGTPIYQGKVDPSVVEFVDKNRAWLKEKPFSLFCTCLDKTGGLDQLGQLQEFITAKAMSLKAIGGRLRIDDLDENDHDLIKEFLNHVNLPFEDMDFYNPEEIVNYSLKLKSIKENLMVPVKKEELKLRVEKFLTGHNTCTLATGHIGRVRSTPIEYSYVEGKLYLLSEGGEKFANLLFNENVSVAVYEDYTSMDSLKGMQITGKASIIEEESVEYIEVLKFKGLGADTVKSLPINMNMIKITMEKVEFLNSQFKDEGADVKQVYMF
jgi:menaquinone-dependent protoporphyrinogen IX oxidase/uncharacterized protein YhbP (UPF0306 family)